MSRNKNKPVPAYSYPLVSVRFDEGKQRKIISVDVLRPGLYNHSILKPMRTPTFIFDFDGTIADTHKLIVEIFNDLSSQYQYETINWESIDLFKNMTPRQIIRHLKVPVLKIPSIISEGKKRYLQKITFVEPFHGLTETFVQLKEIGVRIGILSSNSKENIEKFLNHHELSVFDFIYPTARVLSKNNALNRLLVRHRLNKNDVVYIGDEIRDIQAAKKLGIKVAAVAWGYNSVSSLMAYQPDFLIQKPADLLDISV